MKHRWTYFNEILFEIQKFLFEKMHMKMSCKQWLSSCLGINVLTLKHQEMHGCVVSTVATDALVLKHQAISILSTD